MKTLHLIDGSFSLNDSVELLTRLVQTKINYHELKIATLENEEDIKMREQRIKTLQQELQEMVSYLKLANKPLIELKADAEITC